VANAIGQGHEKPLMKHLPRYNRRVATRCHPSMTCIKN
jgi:hypothetical protein